MDAVNTAGDRHVRAFRAADAFAIEVIQAARGLGREEGEGLARDIRRAAARSGGALVAATASGAGDPAERRALETARAGLLEVRYYLYLARRLGWLELRRYKELAARQDTALRELDALLQPVRAP